MLYYMGCRFSIKVHSGKKTPVQRERKGSQTTVEVTAPDADTDTESSSPEQIEIKTLEKKLDDIKKLEKEKQSWKP